MFDSTAGRLTTAILGHLLVFGALFYLVLATPAYTTTFEGGFISEVALAVILTAMLTYSVGVGVGTTERFYRSGRFWKHICAAAITANVVIGAHSLSFADMNALPGLLNTYYTSPVGLGLLIVATLSLSAYLYLARAGEPLWESVVAALMIGAVATLLFSLTGVWALMIVALTTIGFAAASRGTVKTEG